MEFQWSANLSISLEAHGVAFPKLINTVGLESDYSLVLIYVVCMKTGVWVINHIFMNLDALHRGFLNTLFC